MREDTKQVVEVEFPGGGKTYSYIGSGNLRVGQKINNAPVNHYRSGKPYTAPVTVVATHQVAGVEVGDTKGVSNGRVHSIPTGLKYLPGAREYQQDRTIDIRGEEMNVSEYMSEFSSDAAQRLLSRNTNVDTSRATQRLLGGRA